MNPHVEAGRLGGVSRSPKKQRAAAANLVKAREAQARRRELRAAGALPPEPPSDRRKSEAARAESARKMTAVMRRRMAEEPERVREISSANGKHSCAYVYRCDECRREFRGPSVHFHQQRRGHVGVTVLATPPKENP